MALPIIYCLIHIIIIDFPNIILDLGKLDILTSVPDSFNAIGLIILIILIIGGILLSIYYIVKFDKYIKKTLSISVISILICSLISIFIVYDFLRLFTESFPLDIDLIPAVYFPRLFLVILFIVSILIISIGFLLLLKNHFTIFSEYNDLIFPGILILFLNMGCIFFFLS